MRWNGIVISQDAPGPNVLPDTKYRGIGYGVPWPLELHQHLSKNDDNLIQELDNSLPDYMFNESEFPPQVITDVDLAKRYALKCFACGIKVRLLLCASPRSLPALDNETTDKLLKSSRILGFDFGYTSCDFSAVYSDLHPAPSRLEAFVNMLNDVELFSTYSDLNYFISARRDFLATSRERIVNDSGFEFRVSVLEDTGDFSPFEVREILISNL